MLRRKIHNELQAWKQSPQKGYAKKALLVKGGLASCRFSVGLF